MTITGIWKVICITCGQKAELLFRPETQDFILLPHKTVHEFKCATSDEVYPNEIVERIFGREDE